jgi:hypothetical protein
MDPSSISNGQEGSKYMSQLSAACEELGTRKADTKAKLSANPEKFLILMFSPKKVNYPISKNYSAAASPNV